MKKYSFLTVLIFLLITLLPAQAQSQRDEPRAMLGTGVITEVAWSPDGTDLAVATTTGAYLFENGQFEQPARFFPVGNSTATDILFSPDGSLVVFSGGDGSVHLWSLETYRQVKTPRAGVYINALRYSPNGRYLIASLGQRFYEGLFIWDTQNDYAAINALLPDDWIADVNFKGDQMLLTSAHKLYSSDGTTITELNTFRPNPAASHMHLSNGGKWLYVASGASFVINTETLTRVFEWQTVGNTFAYSPDERYLLTMMEDRGFTGSEWSGIYVLLHLENAQPHSFNVTSQFYGLTENTFVYVDSAGIHLWDLATQTDRQVISAAEPTRVQTDLLHMDQGKLAVLFYDVICEPDCGRANEIVQVWDVDSGIIEATFPAPGVYDINFPADDMVLLHTAEAGMLYHLATGEQVAALSPGVLHQVSGDKLALVDVMTASNRNRLLIHDLGTDQAVTAALPGHQALLRDLAFSPDGNLLVSAGDDQKLLLWNILPGTATPLHTGDVRTVVFGPSDQWIAFSDGSTINLWNIYLQPELMTTVRGVLQGHAAPITALALSNDGMWLASADELGVILVWDLNTALQAGFGATIIWSESIGYKLEHRGIAGRIMSLAFNPDGTLLAAGGNYPLDGGGEGDLNSGVELWSLETRNPVWMIYTEQFDTVADVAFVDNGRLIATAGFDIKLWETGSGGFYGMIYGRGRDISGLAANPTGSLIAASLNGVADYGSADETAIWDVSTGRQVIHLQRPLSFLEGGGGQSTLLSRPADFDSTGTRLAVTDVGGAINVWDVVLNAPGVLLDAYCDTTQVPLITAQDQITVQWSWYATEPELITDHMNAVEYHISLDQRPVETFYPGMLRRDPANDNHWTLYWTLPLGQLAPGEHVIGYRAVWEREISDGMQAFGPDTANIEDVGACHFTVG